MINHLIQYILILSYYNKQKQILSRIIIKKNKRIYCDCISSNLLLLTFLNAFLTGIFSYIINLLF